MPNARYAHQPDLWGTWSFYQCGVMAGRDLARSMPAHELKDITISQTRDCRGDGHTSYVEGFRDGWRGERVPVMQVVNDAVVRID